MLINITKTLKLELIGNKEIIIEYEKPGPNNYVASIEAHDRQIGQYVDQDLRTPLQKDYRKIRVDSDEHFEEDIIAAVLEKVENGSIIWKYEVYED